MTNNKRFGKLYFIIKIFFSTQSLDEAFKNNFHIHKNRLLVAAQELDFISQVFLNMYKQYRSTSLEFDLFESHRSNVISSVQKGHYNLGLLVQTSREAKAFDWQLKYTNLEVEYLDYSDVYVILGPKSKFYHSKSLTFKDVKEIPQICLNIDEIAKAEYKNHSQYFHINMDKVIFCNSINLCKQLLQNTDMILFASKWELNFFKDTDTKILQIKNNDNINNLIYIKRKNEPLTPIEMQFLTEIKKVIRSELGPIS